MHSGKETETPTIYSVGLNVYSKYTVENVLTVICIKHRMPVRLDWQESHINTVFRKKNCSANMWRREGAEEEEYGGDGT